MKTVIPPNTQNQEFPLKGIDMGNAFPRAEMMTILTDYNRLIGNEATEQIARLEDRPCVVTGQQPGFMGGPSYTILKGIRCLQVAKQCNAVPIFWLATEDHDITEVNHAYLIDELANLKSYPITLPKDGRAVEDLILTEKNVSEMEVFATAAGIEVELPEPGTPYALAMARLLVCLFAGTGMVFLEPRLLRPLAKSFFQREILEAKEIQAVLKATTAKVEAEGGKIGISVGSGTNLFLKDSRGHRIRIMAIGDKTFMVGEEKYTQKDLLDLIEQEPERFSPNVAARPVLQNLLLPVIAYVGGPSEVEYHRQLGDYHEYHGVKMPSIIPRLSATLISPEIATLLEKNGVEPWEEIPLTAKGHDMHLLRNWLYPHQKLQERTLNWWGFHGSENLVQACLKNVSWNTLPHQYLYY